MTVTTKVTRAPRVNRLLNAVDERTLQHPQHGQSPERGDESGRRGQHQPGEQRREESEQDGQQAAHDARGVMPGALAGSRQEGVRRAGEAGGHRADGGRRE